MHVEIYFKEETEFLARSKNQEPIVLEKCNNNFKMCQLANNFQIMLSLIEKIKKE